MGFRGWSPRAVEFYDQLEADNSREYWHGHKAVYAAEVRAPMEALLLDLEHEFGEGRIFRPNRDTRFSADKTPYKTAIAATFERGGYVQFSADGLGVGCGYYMMATDQLERYRRAIDDGRASAALMKVIARIEDAGIQVSSRDQLKTAPRGYAKDHPRVDLLRRKGLHTWRDWPYGKWLASAKAEERVVETLRASRPLLAWLDKHVGPSSESH
jgi:uncharacterized protein (TIGR02453 family)